jgi:ubiquinone/menaquinone biosynthesis C-methylase UbiE
MPSLSPEPAGSGLAASLTNDVGVDDAADTSAEPSASLVRPGLSPEFAEHLFTGAADLYAAHRPGYPDQAFADLAGTLRLGPASRVLDVGCGPGTISLPLAGLVGEVVAVDPNLEMLATARRAAEERGIANVTFHQGRAEDLPGLPLGAIDHVLFGRSFHWTDRARVIAQLDRLLPADGAIVLVHPARREAGPGRIWDPIVDEIRIRFVGERGSAGDPRAHIDMEKHADVLAASVFSQIERTKYFVQREYSIDRVVGLQLTFSYTTPRRLGGRAEEYAAAVRQGLLNGLGPGPYQVEEGTEVLVARRP